MIKENEYIKLMSGVKLIPKEGVSYWRDYQTGQFYEIDTTHPNYLKRVEEKDREAKQKKEQKKKTRKRKNE